MTQPKNPMTAILAHHLNRQDKVEQWVAALPHYLTAASPDDVMQIVAGLDQGQGQGNPEGVQPQQQNSDRLSVLVDGDSQKMVTQLYQDYVSETNFVLFIEFVKGMDRYIQNFRKLAQSREIAQQVPQEEDEDAEIGGGRSRGRSRGRRRAPGKPQPALDAAPQPNPEELQADDAPSATVASGPATKALAAFFGSHIAGQ